MFAKSKLSICTYPLSQALQGLPYHHVMTECQEVHLAHDPPKIEIRLNSKIIITHNFKMGTLKRMKLN